MEEDANEVLLSGYKLIKDRLTFTVRQRELLLVYHSEMCRAFKSRESLKEKKNAGYVEGKSNGVAHQAVVSGMG